MEHAMAFHMFSRLLFPSTLRRSDHYLLSRNPQRSRSARLQSLRLPALLCCGYRMLRMLRCSLTLPSPLLRGTRKLPLSGPLCPLPDQQASRPIR